MTKSRTALIATLTALVGSLATLGVVAGTSGASPSSPAAAPTVYSLTLSGMDAHTLDPQLPTMFVSGGGATLVLSTIFEGPQHYKYLELSLNLPVGAKVTSISVSGRGCMGGLPVVFGSYSPATRSTVRYFSNMLVPGGCVGKTATRIGNPITTVAAGRRYAIDVNLIDLSGYPKESGDEPTGDTLYGATVKYTCTSPCVP